jgi:RNA polymerase sigma factor (TIGR02999 family)
MTDATQMLEDHAAGKSGVAERLLPQVYDQLRALAGSYLKRERPGHTLQPTELVHEAYMRLVDDTRISWAGKTHFFAIAAMHMRRILVDSVRACRAQKRGGGLAKVTLDDHIVISHARSLGILELNEALEKLGRLNERQARVVDLRFFGGLNVEETAFVLRVSKATVKQDWRMARAWISRELDLVEKD